MHKVLTAMNINSPRLLPPVSIVETYPAHVQSVLLRRVDCHQTEERFTPVVFVTIFRKDL